MNPSFSSSSPFARQPVPRLEQLPARAQLTQVLASLYSARPTARRRRRRPGHPDALDAAYVFGLTALAQLLFFAILALTGS